MDPEQEPSPYDYGDPYYDEPWDEEDDHPDIDPYDGYDAYESYDDSNYGDY